MLGLISLLLLGLFRDGAAIPLLTFLAALILFVVPGALLTRLLAGGLPFVARLPVAFAVSVGLFGLVAVPMFVLHRSLTSYLQVAGGIVVVSLVGLAATALLGRPAVEKEDEASGDGGRWLWIPFLVFATLLAFVSSRVSHSPSEDTWLYLTYLQDYVGRDRLSLYPPYAQGEVASFTRMTINGWLVELAALSRVSGLEPARMLLSYMAPALVVVALLSFYTLARTLLGNARALWAGCLLALFFLVTLGSTPTPPGAEFVGRITEDKFAARYLFLPVALSLAALLLKGRRRLGPLALLVFVCWSAPVVHPLGWTVVGICLGGLGLVHLAANLRRKESWLAVGALGFAAVGVAIAPAAYLLWKGISVSSVMGGSDPNRVTKQLLSAEKNQHLLILGDGSYILHPALLLSPVLLAAYAVGVPFLLWRVRGSVPAQLLLGILFIVPALLYVPPVATLLAGIVEPWHLWRLAWPLPLAAVLTLAWASAEAMGYLQARMESVRKAGRLAPFLPLALVVMLAAVASPAAANGIRSAAGTGEEPLARTACADPVFLWMQENIKTDTMVMAPDAENSCIPAHATHANVLTYRSTGLLAAQGGAGGTPEGAAQISPVVKNAKKFFKSRAVDEDMLGLLRDNAVAYLLLPASSQLNTQLPHLPGFSEIDAPGERYRLYGVEFYALGPTPLIEANGLLNGGKWRQAEGAYVVALETTVDEGERFSALLGVGQAYTKRKLFEDAVLAYEAAIELAPGDPAPHALLAETYEAAGDPAAAADSLETAAGLQPGDAAARLVLAESLSATGREREAVEHYRAVVEEYPRVPEYRARLGEALGMAGDGEAARQQLERAVSLDPLSAKLHQSVAGAYARAGDGESAASHRQRAGDLEKR